MAGERETTNFAPSAVPRHVVMTIPECVLLVLILFAVVAPAPSAQAATVEAALLGTSNQAAVSDGRSMIAFGEGASAMVSRDEDLTPANLPLSPGCEVAAASTGTGLVECSDGSAWSLLSLRTGTSKPLPGAGLVSGPGSDAGRILGMGSKWLVGEDCSDHSCDAVAVQWHTGAHRSFFNWSEWYYPNTVLDSSSLRPSNSEPYVHENARTSQLKYHRGRFTKSLGMSSNSRSSITDVHVSGWRVAWQSFRNKGAQAMSVVVLNAKTGRRVALPFHRFEVPGQRFRQGGRTSLTVTKKRLVLTYALTDGGIPNDRGNLASAVVTLPWPREVR